MGNFDESLPACEDYALWLKMAAREPVHFLDEALTIKHGGHEDRYLESIGEWTDSERRYWRAC